jgi:hypothetical protein
MDIRVVESMATSGGLADATYRQDGDIENISLDWDNDNKKLAVVDYNMNYSLLPWQLYTDCVKKVFLTYNGKSCGSGVLIETVVMESNDDDDINQLPDYNNSNQWEYTPSEFNYPSELLEMTDLSDYVNMPYDYREGFTVVKQFLTAQANLAPGTPAYTAFYRAPHLTSFIPANVEGNRIYTDGWYTSYVCLVKTWTAANPPANGASTGDIVYYEGQEKFYINLNGNGGTLIEDPDDSSLMIPDPAEWKEDPTFDEWQTLMRNNLGDTSVDDPIYFIETQHLVTVELNSAILCELKKQCGCCESPQFNLSQLATYIKLMQKRLGAWVQFNEELFHEAACVLESSRSLCNMCLYHQSCSSPSGTC